MTALEAAVVRAAMRVVRLRLLARHAAKLSTHPDASAPRQVAQHETRAADAMLERSVLALLRAGSSQLDDDGISIDELLARATANVVHHGKCDRCGAPMRIVSESMPTRWECSRHIGGTS